MLRNKYINNNSKILDKKLFPILIIGYIINVISCIIYSLLYVNNIFYSDNILILFSIFPIFISWLYLITERLVNNPSGDLEYLEKNYPEIHKYLRYTRVRIYLNPLQNFYDRNKAIFVWSDFKNGYLTKDGDDVIIDEMYERWRKKWNLIINCPIILFFGGIVISIICITLKD